MPAGICLDHDDARARFFYAVRKSSPEKREFFEDFFRRKDFCHCIKKYRDRYIGVFGSVLSIVCGRETDDANDFSNSDAERIFPAALYRKQFHLLQYVFLLQFLDCILLLAHLCSLP